MQAQAIFLLFSVKLIEYNFSALSVCSNPCVGPFLKIKISFFLLSIFIDELISTSKIITFLPNPIPGDEKTPCLSNPILYPEYPYLSMSTFLVNLAVPIISCWITAYVKIISYFINNENIYYFSIKKCGLVLF